MRGVVKILELYLSKAPIDDDDVAVLHGPAERGYPLLTEAMVNVRETLGAAVAEGVLSPDAARGVEQTAKSIFYKERTWEHLLDCAKGTVGVAERSEEHTSELQSLMRISYAVFCLKQKTNLTTTTYSSRIHE